MSKSYNNFPKGSEWRKWDLHVHTPDTKLNFHGFEIDEKWKKYCQTLEESDVAVFGITDYFSINNYFRLLEKYQSKYPLTNKTFFPNIEFRTESKNSNNEHIQVHVLFSNSKSTTDKISEFLTRLKLVSTDNETMQKKFCTTKDLDEIGYDKAMVHMNELVESLSDGFAKNEYLIIGVANGYGSLRPNGKNNGKGGEYAKELDKKYQAFFGTSRNRGFYLNKIQGREEFSLPAKPVVTGSDAHSFVDLSNKLGKTFYENHSFEDLLPHIKIDTKSDDLVRTIHSSKGTEFNNVMIHFDSIEDFRKHIFDCSNHIDGEQDDARISYVGCSRAMKRLLFNVPEVNDEDINKLNQMNINHEILA